jgi:hypothetical protein
MPASLPSHIDFERHAFVVQRDHRGLATATEWNAHASQADIARALCDNDLPDCAVIRIVECNPSEGWARDVTEDVARLIPAICNDALRDGWRIRACARALLLRFDLDGSDEDEEDDEAEMIQLGWDRERERCAMAASIGGAQS